MFYNYEGEFNKISLQSIEDASATPQRTGKEIQCTLSESKMKVERRNGNGKTNLDLVKLSIDRNSCTAPKDNKKECDVKLLQEAEYLKWKSNYQPKITYTLVSN